MTVRRRPGDLLAVQLNNNLLFWTVPTKIIVERYGVQVFPSVKTWAPAKNMPGRRI
ncbi:MAG: hypothetical protein KCHDKBKB_01939 [Elusimicrobia bacterium]|nr:hypothetical protein [Elusimicrobiota bacterium]